eukprot:scaffold24696_cov101-Phaeocystis_antarctica.AAC.2
MVAPIAGCLPPLARVLCLDVLLHLVPDHYRGLHALQVVGGALRLLAHVFELGLAALALVQARGQVLHVLDRMHSLMEVGQIELIHSPFALAWGRSLAQLVGVEIEEPGSAQDAPVVVVVPVSVAHAKADGVQSRPVVECAQHVRGAARLGRDEA